MNAIGQNIKRLRVLAAMSQNELAHRLNKTSSAISQYESGKIIPRMGVIEQLAAIFGVDKTEIIGSTANAITTPEAVNETELLDIYRNLDTRGKRQLLAIARAMVD